MIKKAMMMKLLKGKENEYKKRHDELWPEMLEMLKMHGILSYSIFLEPLTLNLYAYLEIENEEKWLASSETEINQKWWNYMADIMETNPDNSPISLNLIQVFNY